LEAKKQNLYFILFGIFVANTIVAEIIGAKIFSVEQTLGMQPLNLQVGGFSWSLNQPAGALNWPFVFIISDLINEYFGKKGLRKISFITAGLVAYCFIVIYISTALHPADFWVEVNKGSDNFNINTAFSKIFRQGLGIIIGSLSAFLFSQLIDTYVFHKIKEATNNKKIWLRATGSTLVSQLIDSIVVIGIAFVLFGNWSVAQWLSTSINSYLYKFGVAILLTPVIYWLHAYIDNYLGINQEQPKA
jgi:queuosine precursor transporter